MRTVKVTYNLDLGSGNRMSVETEIIIDNEDEAEQAGYDANGFIMAFNSGLTRSAEDMT